MSIGFRITAHFPVAIQLFFYDGGKRLYLFGLYLPFFDLSISWDWSKSHHWHKLNFWHIYIFFYPFYRKYFTFNKIFRGIPRPKDEIDYLENG